MNSKDYLDSKNEQDIDDDYEYFDIRPRKQSNFDEIDEFIDEITIQNGNEKSIGSKSGDSSLVEEEEEIERSSPILNYKSAFIDDHSETTGKSKFFIPKVNSSTNVPLTKELNLELREIFDEKILHKMDNVSCLFSENSCLNNSHLIKEPRNGSVYLDGKLLLTNFRLIFLPDQNQNHTDTSKIFKIDKRLNLFNYTNAYIVSIPLVSIYEIKASSSSSEKYKKLATILESKSDLNIRDLIVKCKNFMTKCFILNEKKYDLLYAIAGYNSLAVIQNRFKNIITSLNEKKSQTSTESERFSTSRISYFDPSDLQQELIDSNIIDYMQVKNGSTIKFDTKFWIHMNSPFSVIPLNILDIIKQRRVVINESYVQEFGGSSDLNSNNSNGKEKKIARLGSFLSSSPKSAKNSSQQSNQPIQFQQPITAQLSHNNPFFNNSFPVWSYTDTYTGCSLFVVPEANRQEESDIILKNLNALICDEEYKLKNIPKEHINISQTLYSEYEFFKFKVPFSYHKIELSYQKLYNLCSFKSIEDYQDETDNTFHSKLNSTKWLKHVSEVLCLTTKIINSLNCFQRNVFIEEYRDHMDISCVLTSLTKICLNPKYRTITGLENLLQKDWFLAGHLFYKRLNEIDDKKKGVLDEEKDNKKISGISPVFLFFLDCLFQLLTQYPSEFEFNEFYLINLWDYSLTGLSLTYSFDGMLDFFNFINTNSPNSIGDKTLFQKAEQSGLNEIFDENNKFWLSHLEKYGHFLSNKFFSKTKSEKKRLVLVPCDRIYMLKFWSKCYLRWVERFHPYNSHELDCDEVRPPPLPPKPPKETDKVDLNQLSDAEILTLMNNGCPIATTRITEDGHIETSF
ncbi:unnamed protein product [Brachionus calyciflorus]|uniref:Myotubularin phosphatase domain-containing protein n=1 Tax=Brachionus calyciflorus TaxID=104777 RepID=A0A813S5K8_9BILA|nr:unnamed protein product [Brachionus calyciflorus]